VSFVDVKSETKMNNKREGYITTDSDSNSLEEMDDCDDSEFKVLTRVIIWKIVFSFKVLTIFLYASF
jgi:hypothetical protein